MIVFLFFSYSILHYNITSHTKSKNSRFQNSLNKCNRVLIITFLLLEENHDIQRSYLFEGLLLLDFILHMFRCFILTHLLEGNNESFYESCVKLLLIKCWFCGNNKKVNNKTAKKYLLNNITYNKIIISGIVIGNGNTSTK